jgi:hypothetical protein
MLSLLLDDDAEGAGLVGFSLYKHGAKVLRGTQNAAYQSVILLIFKKFQSLTPINVENRNKTTPENLMHLNVRVCQPTKEDDMVITLASLNRTAVEGRDTGDY